MLPRPLESFILRDQAKDLLKAPGVVALEPPKIPYGALGRVSLPWALGVAGRQARRLKLPGTPAAVAIFHPFQFPLAAAIQARHPDAELWYGRWDRYEAAYDAGPRTRKRLETLHELASERSELTFVASEALADIEREAGKEPVLVPLAADSFPAPDPAAAVVAVSLGHLGIRTDWALLRAVAEAMPELVLLLVGERHDDECGKDPDFRACLELPNLIWLGRRSDEEAARLILCADVGIVPFEHSPFNDAALPYRIIKYARLGRRTVTPALAGVRTWARAVISADGPEAFVEALRSQAGVRSNPDLKLRDWALSQTARAQNQPLWERMENLGIASGRLGSERTR